MINSNLYYPIETKVISSKNRFALKATDILELKKDLSGSSILITGQIFNKRGKWANGGTGRRVGLKIQW